MVPYRQSTPSGAGSVCLKWDGEGKESRTMSWELGMERGLRPDAVLPGFMSITTDKVQNIALGFIMKKKTRLYILN